MRLRFSILAILVITTIAAMVVALAQRSMLPANSVHFHNDTGAEISELSLKVSPVLSSNSNELGEIRRQSLLAGESIILRHDYRYPTVNFRYTTGGRQFEYNNVDVSQRPVTHIRTLPTGEWAGSGK